MTNQNKRTRHLATQKPTFMSSGTPSRSRGGRLWQVVGAMEARGGGISRTVAEVALSFRRRGTAVTILAGAHPGCYEEDRRTWRYLGEHGIELHIEPATSRLRLFRCPKLTEILSAKMQPGDVVHLHGIWEGLLWDAAKIARARGIPHVVFPQGALDRWSMNRRKWKKQAAWLAGAGRMLRQASAVQCLTDWECKEVGRFGLPALLAKIPNGVDLSHYDCRESREQRTIGDAGERPPLNILFMSRIHPKKGVTLLINAFAHLARQCPDATLTVAGFSADTTYLNDCKSLARRLGVESNVRWIGPVWDEAKLRALAQADLFALPSYQEGFSLVVLEALAAGLPVLITNECRFPDVQTHAAGRVVPAESNAVAQALVELAVLDPRLRRAMGRRAQELVQQRYTWDIVTTQLADLYTTLGAAI
jgi:glycosyltransferase involved in cell wall biosynthesis